MDTCRMELSTRNVQITNACPGPTQSEITLHAFAEDGRELGTADEAGAAARMPAERCALLMASLHQGQGLIGVEHHIGGSDRRHADAEAHKVVAIGREKLCRVSHKNPVQV